MGSCQSLDWESMSKLPCAHWTQMQRCRCGEMCKYGTNIDQSGYQIAGWWNWCFSMTLNMQSNTKVIYAAIAVDCTPESGSTWKIGTWHWLNFLCVYLYWVQSPRIQIFSLCLPYTCVSSRHSRKCVTLLKLMTEMIFFSKLLEHPFSDHLFLKNFKLTLYLNR